MTLTDNLTHVWRDRFLRHILLASLVIFLMGPIAGRLLLIPLFEANLLRATEAEAVRAARFLGTRLDLSGGGVSPDSLSPELDAYYREEAHHLGVRQLNIFSAAGVVIYSTRAGAMGEINHHDYFRDRVAKGHVHTSIVRKGGADLHGEPVAVDVVETYVPLVTESGEFAGAFESYHDITARLAGLQRLADSITVVICGAAALLFGAMVVLLGRAGREAEERRRMEREMGELYHKHQMILDTAAEGIFGVDTAGRLTFMNRAAVDMLGWQVNELMGGGHHELIHHTKAGGSPNPAEECPVSAAFLQGKPQRSDGEVFWRRDGTGFPVEMTAAPLVDDGTVAGAVVVFRDISERLAAERHLKEANARLEHLVRIDGLTGVSNRLFFEEFMDTAWRHHLRRGQPLTVLLVDVDAFKAYNDHYGHQAGDCCLRQVAKALASQLYRPTDHVARYGGEEFVMVLTDTDVEGAAKVAERFCQGVRALAIPHEALGGGASVTVSVAVAAMVPRRGQSADELIKAADDALYAAKSQGRNCWVASPGAYHRGAG